MRIPRTNRRLRPMILSAAMAAPILTGGCGGIDGVELNGGVFDALGVATKTAAAPKEPKLAERPGLVVPPRAYRLPEPGSGAVAQPKAEAWPQDPEERKAFAAADAERRHAAFCEKALSEAKIRKDESTPIRGPNGMCN